MGQGSSTTPSPPPVVEEKKKLKICCACPETRKARDECLALHGEDKCADLIEAHKQCLRKEGFNI